MKDTLPVAIHTPTAVSRLAMWLYVKQGAFTHRAAVKQALEILDLHTARPNDDSVYQACLNSTTRLLR